MSFRSASVAFAGAALVSACTTSPAPQAETQQPAAYQPVVTLNEICQDDVSTLLMT